MYKKRRGDPIEVKGPGATHRNQEAKSGGKGKSWMKMKRSKENEERASIKDGKRSSKLSFVASLS